MLKAEQLAAFRGERLVFRGLDLALAPGDALLVHGPNGAGKTTLLRVLAGLVHPAAGRLEWNGADALDDLIEHAARVAYVGHLDAVKPGLTVAENMRFFARVSHGSLAGALVAAELAPLADLPARMLSAGQKRRLALARLALSSAPLWLLDEPTLGLDARAVERFGTLLADHRARGGIVVAATHMPLPLQGAGVITLGGANPTRVTSPDAGADRITSCQHLDHAAAGPSIPNFAIAAAILRRELRLSFRQGADTLAALLFFLVAASLFPFAIGPAPETLGRIAPGIVWVCALLAAVLPLDRLFGVDWEDGSLDQLLLTGLPPAMTAGAKAAAHWLTTGLPLLIAAGPVAVTLRIPSDSLGALLAGLALGTPALSLLGTAGAAIVLGARRGGVLLPLLVLPLSLPLLVFGTAAADAVAEGLTPRPNLLILAAILAIFVPLSVVAGGAALRSAAE